MAFSELTKLEVKKRAAFRCCRCQSIGIEIHHIVPQADKGPDTLENAAPLCPSCHDYFGANPVKRKEITEMRNWWYKVAAVKYAPNPENETALAKITDELKTLRDDKSQNTQALEELKQSLKGISDQIIDKVGTQDAAGTASRLLELSEVKLANISDLKPGPIRHDQLPDSYLNRILVIYWIFSEYLSISQEETIDNFKRDLHPEREIEVWERMAAVILALKYDHGWNKEKIKTATGLALMLSTGPLTDKLAGDTKLSDDEIQVIIDLWGDSPLEPITVTSSS